MTSKFKYNLTRFIIIVINAYLLNKFTNPSTVYHWIRGQPLFKLHMIKAVNEIIDLLLKGFGHGIVENFSRAMLRDINEQEEESNKDKSSLNKIIWHPLFDKVTAILSMIVYGTSHSFILAMEMFTMHVVLTSSNDSISSFLFYNNFSEVKITVFKKCDIPGLFQYACNDGVERF